MLIEKCSFKRKWWKGIEEPIDIIGCKLMPSTQDECVGEEKCVLFQTYKVLCLFAQDYTDRIMDMRKGLIEQGLLRVKK